MSKKDGREKALDMALANLTKRFGEGTVMRLGEATHLQVETIPTGTLALDRALGPSAQRGPGEAIDLHEPG